MLMPRITGFFLSVLVLLLLATVNRTTANLQPPELQPQQQDDQFGYTFEYGVRDEASGTLYGHTESRSGLTTTGQYTVHLPDGRTQTVKYTADHNGYRATVSYDRPAIHPDKILDKKQRATHHPPAVLNHRVPVVGGSSASSSRIPDVGGTSNRVPVIGGTSNRIPVVGGTSNRVPVVGGTSNRVPVVGRTSNLVPVVGGISNTVPVVDGTSNRIPVVGGTSNRFPVAGGTSGSSNRVPVVGRTSTYSNRIPVVGGTTISSNRIPVVGGTLSSSNRIPLARGTSAAFNRIPVVGVTLSSSNRIPFARGTSAPSSRLPVVGVTSSNHIPVKNNINKNKITASNNGNKNRIAPTVPFPNHNNNRVPSRINNNNRVPSRINNNNIHTNGRFPQINNVHPTYSPSYPRVPVPTVPVPTRRPKPQPFTVPVHSNIPAVMPPRSQFPGRPWHHFTQSPTIHTNTKLSPSTSYLPIPQTNANHLPIPSDTAHFSYLPVNSKPNKPVPTVTVPSVPHNNEFSNINTFKNPPSGSLNKKQNKFSPANTNNFNEFYNLPSSSIRTRPRVLPPNTYIPSASAPIFPVSNNVQTSQAYNIISLSPNRITHIPTVPFVDHTNILNQHSDNSINLNTGSLTKLQPPYITSLNKNRNYGLPSTHLIPPTRHTAVPNENISSQLRPPYHSNYNNVIPNHLYGVPQMYGSSFNNHISDTKSSYSFGTGNTVPSLELKPQTNSSIQSINSDENLSASTEKSEHTTRPTPQPVIVPEYNSLTPFSSQAFTNPFPNVFIQPLDHRHPFTRKPFIFDPDASVFHDQPSIIVDFSHRGSSHEDDSDSVSLTAPYVVVASPYSPNPEGKFNVNSEDSVNPNSVANHGITLADPAEAGNVRLAPGFLPPHLARLRLQKLEGEPRRTVPAPNPVRLKLSNHNRANNDHSKANSKVTSSNDNNSLRFNDFNQFQNLNRKNLPLRNRPSTFGEGTPHQFIPNSVAQFERLPKQKRSSSRTGKVQTTSDPNENLEKVNDHVSEEDAFREKNISEDETIDSSSLSKAVSSRESRPLIRNG